MKHLGLIALLFGAILFSQSCIIKSCQVFTVIGKSKCTFDREQKARVCVVKMGKIENQAMKSIRGRAISTILPEPLEPYLTQVEMCIKDGKRVFTKL